MGGIVSHLLLLRDQASYKRRFEEIKGKNPALAILFVIFDLGKMP